MPKFMHLVHSKCKENYLNFSRTVLNGCLTRLQKGLRETPLTFSTGEALKELGVPCANLI